MSAKPDRRGRPPLTDIQINTMADRLVPHLRGGLSLTKACEVEGVDPTTVRKYKRLDSNFSTRLDQARRYKSIKLGYITSTMLEGMAAALKDAIESKRSLKDVFDRSQLSFLRAVMVYDRSVHDEYGADELTEPPDKDKYSFSAPRNDREAKLQEQVLNRHHDYVRAKKAVNVRSSADDDQD